ncbi:MarR family transcriptional regulator [Nocardioides zeae]|uniref:MarR family transcriptional regulator n=1 Tax=Nocardioides zeae TaxID=1457234 RepID=A0A6P0HQ65_9ACTN|nr:MarR family transcriptional regulator [Nocardioides zeae]
MDERERDADAVEATLVRIQDLFTDVRVDALVASELTLQQLKVLMLAVYRAPLSAHDVAGTLGVSAATVSGLVGRLVDHGLLRQEPAPDDRRVRHLRATEAGEGALDQVARLQVQHRRELLVRLSDAELAALRLGLAGIERAAREVRDRRS